MNEFMPFLSLRASWLCAQRSLCLLAFATATCMAATPAAQRIDTAELLSRSWTGRVISNTAFTPSSNSGSAHAPFLGTLRLSEAQMIAWPAKFSPRSVMGRDPKRFPGVALSFFTHKGDLVPFQQDVIRYGTSGQGRSYWDIIVQPGQVWSESGDGDWSRAGFPFSLVNSIEGETHNGLATFLYKDGKVSNLRFQIVQQTAPFNIDRHFVAAGIVPAMWAPAEVPDLESMQRAYEAQRDDAVPMTDWRELEAKAGAAALRGFDGPMDRANIVMSGLDYQGHFYLKACNSAGGPLPWCDRVRFGVWSATKVLANETALLRLAEKYGPAVFEAKIADYVPEVAGHTAWMKVRFEDAINMATGIGNGTTKRQPNDSSDGYIDARYAKWYEAASVRAKMTALVRDGRVYPWAPGEVSRYRDQDMFILGLAMDRFLKAKEGPAVDIWSMLQKEVFAPIGIHHAPTNRTIEADGSAGQPLMAYGYYPTISDMVHIARLYQNAGKHGDQQILYAPRIRELLAGPKAQGLPTGEMLAEGETTYRNAFWITSYAASPNCRLFYPRMIGWGGNIVALLPGGSTGIRLAKSGETTDQSDVNTSGMAKVVDALSGFCSQ